MKSVVLFPNAKINIGLHVTAKRPDGFHAIETLFYPVSLHDVLEIVPAGKFTVALSGLAVAGAVDDNLCVKAYRLLQKDFGLPPVGIYLHKAIPSGAGLGGGSSDAAHTLTLLNTLFRLNLSTQQLAGYASLLGSDCPFFIYNKPMYATGRGEQLTAANIDLQTYHIVLLKPPVFISTAEAYAGVRPKQPAKPLCDLLQYPIREWEKTIANDFEQSVFEKFPALAQSKQQLYAAGAVYAAMSGSGSAIFGLFESEATAIAAAHRLSGVLLCGTMTGNPY